MKAPNVILPPALSYYHFTCCQLRNARPFDIVCAHMFGPSYLINVIELPTQRQLRLKIRCELEF